MLSKIFSNTLNRNMLGIFLFKNDLQIFQDYYVTILSKLKVLWARQMINLKSMRSQYGFGLRDDHTRY